jgi:hypothetical protein
VHLAGFLYSLRPIQPYSFQADLIWCDGTFKKKHFHRQLPFRPSLQYKLTLTGFTLFSIWTDCLREQAAVWPCIFTLLWKDNLWSGLCPQKPKAIGAVLFGVLPSIATLICDLTEVTKDMPRITYSSRRRCSAVNYCQLQLRDICSIFTQLSLAIRIACGEPGQYSKVLMPSLRLHQILHLNHH